MCVLSDSSDQKNHYNFNIPGSHTETRAPATLQFCWGRLSLCSDCATSLFFAWVWAFVAAWFVATFYGTLFKLMKTFIFYFSVGIFSYSIKRNVGIENVCIIKFQKVEYFSCQRRERIFWTFSICPLVRRYFTKTECCHSFWVEYAWLFWQLFLCWCRLCICGRDCVAVVCNVTCVVLLTEVVFIVPGGRCMCSGNWRC